MRLADFLWRRRPADAAPTGTDVVKEVRRLELKSRRLMDSAALGPYESIFRGHGIEFSEVRAYEHGDPFQAIDWKVTARMRKPFVKRFVEERELTVLLVVDVSASNDFGTRGSLKRELAAEVASVLALAAMRSGDRLGLLLFSDRIERHARPARGRNRNLRLLYDLVTVKPEGKRTDVPLALATAARMLPTRSLVFVISDFLGSEGLDRAFLGLASKHDVVAVDIADPAERALPASGWVEVEDPETGARAIVDLGDAGLRAELERRARGHDRGLAAVFGRSHVDVVRLRTDEPFQAALAQFFAARGRRRIR